MLVTDHNGDACVKLVCRNRFGKFNHIAAAAGNEDGKL
jgi:hypothetical protein